MFSFIFENDFPTLGVCLSHQLIALLLGSSVKGDPSKAENGMLDVYLIEGSKNDPVFKSIPSVFKATQAHKDTVLITPKGCVLTLSNEDGTIEGFKYKNNIYTVQFHPELGPEEIEYRWSMYPEYLKSKTDEELKTMRANLVETSHATKVLQNFVDIYIK